MALDPTLYEPLPPATWSHALELDFSSLSLRDETSRAIESAGTLNDGCLPERQRYNFIGKGPA